MADPENFGGGGFYAQNLKNSNVFTKIESDFSAEIGNSNNFFAQNQVVSKKKKEKLFTKIESDVLAEIGNSNNFFSAEFGNSNNFFAQNQVVSKKKKKKKVFTKIESDFSAAFVTFRLVGGYASRNGAELFEIEAVFSAKIVTFRLVGGMHPPHPPHPPPKSATDYSCSCQGSGFVGT